MGVGSAWGSREEFLHPRDRHGRFRKKWKMAESVINAISNFLDQFNPRTFQSDGQSSQYLFNKAKPDRFAGGTEYHRLHTDWDEANAHLRAGEMDPSTQKFVSMMDKSAASLQDDLIVSRTVGPDAFGLRPEQLGAEDGGIEDFTGRLVADRAYTAANIGTPMSHGPGKITITMAVPKGTKAIIPARSRNDRGIFLDRDQELRITKVTPDGQGGYYMLAVATPRTPGQTPEPLNRSPHGVGLNPAQREERVRGSQALEAKRLGIQSDAELHRQNIERGNAQVLQNQPAQLPPAQGAPQQPGSFIGNVPATHENARPQPVTPGGPEPRNEPIHSPSVGGTSTVGKSPSEIAQATPEAPTPTPEAPPTPQEQVPSFRAALLQSGIESPSAGRRRAEWNNAYLGVKSGKKDPADALRELETDISVNKALRADHIKSGTNDPHLAEDIHRQEQLADLISKHFGVPRKGEANTPAQPSGVVPEEHRIPVRGGGFVDTRTGDLHGTNAPTPEAKKASPPKAAPKATPGAPSTSKAAAPAVVERKAPGTAAGKITAGRVQAGDKILVTKIGDHWAPATRKTGATTLTVTSVNRGTVPGRSRSGTRIGITGTDENGNEIRITTGTGLRSGGGVTPSQTFHHVQEGVASPAKKAVPEAPSAPAAKKAVPGRMTLQEAKRHTALDALRENKIEGEGDASYRNIVRNVESGEWSPARARREARSAAKYWKEQSNITKNGSRGTPQQREHAASHDLEVSHKYEKLDEELLKSESVIKTDKYRQRTPEEKAKAVAIHGAAAEEANAPRPLDKMTKAELLKEARGKDIVVRDSWTKPQIRDAILQDKALGKQLEVLQRGTSLQERQGISAPETGGIAKQSLISDLAKDAGIPGDGGGVVPSRQLDLDQGLSEREVAYKIRADADHLDAAPLPAPSSDPYVNELQKKRREESVAQLRDLAARLEAHADLADMGKRKDSPATEAARLRGDVPGGPRGNVPLAGNRPRQREFMDAWKDSGIEAPGSAGRSLNEVVDDIHAGRLTPEQGIQRIENDIKFDHEDIGQIDAQLRGDVTPKERSQLLSDRDRLQERIKAQEQASSWMRKYFKQEPIATPQEIQVHLDPEAKRALDAATPEGIKEAAKAAGFPEPDGNTKDEVIQSIVRHMAGERLKELEAKKATKAAKAAKKAAPEAPKIPVERGKVDARLVAEGLNLDENDHFIKSVLDDAQRALDGEQIAGLPKNPTPAAVGRWVQKTAQSFRGHHAVRYGYHPSPEERARKPEFFDDAQRQLDRAYAIGDKVEEFGKRLEKVRRPSVKATPKIPAPEAKAVAKADALQARVSNDLLDRVRGARDRNQAEDILKSGATMNDLRSIGSGMGLKDRTKEGLRTKILDALHPDSGNNIEVVGQIKDLTPTQIMRGEHLTPAGRKALNALGPEGHPRLARISDPEEKIREAYRMLAVPGGGSDHYVGFEDMRKLVGDQLSRQQFDDTVRQMAKKPDVRISPQHYGRENAATRIPAAIQFGGQEHDQIHIDDPSLSRPSEFGAVAMQEELNNRKAGRTRDPLMSKLSDAELLREIDQRAANDPIVARDLEAMKVKSAPTKATPTKATVTQLPTARKETAIPSRPATVTQLPVAKGGRLPPGLQEVVTNLRKAQNEQQAREALAGLLGVELKRILVSLGLSDVGGKGDLIQRLIGFATR